GKHDLKRVTNKPPNQVDSLPQEGKRRHHEGPTRCPTPSHAACSTSHSADNTLPSHSVAEAHASVVPSQNEDRAGPTQSINAETLSPNEVNAPASTLISTAATLATMEISGARMFCTNQLITLAKTSITFATIFHTHAMACSAPMTRKIAARITPPRIAPTTLRIGSRIGASA